MNDSHNKGSPFPRLALNMSPSVGANAFWQPADSCVECTFRLMYKRNRVAMKQTIINSNIKKTVTAQGNFLFCSLDFSRKSPREKWGLLTNEWRTYWYSINFNKDLLIVKGCGSRTLPLSLVSTWHSFTPGSPFLSLLPYLGRLTFVIIVTCCSYLILYKQ